MNPPDQKIYFRYDKTQPGINHPSPPVLGTRGPLLLDGLRMHHAGVCVQDVGRERALGGHRGGDEGLKQQQRLQLEVKLWPLLALCKR